MRSLGWWIGWVVVSLVACGEAKDGNVARCDAVRLRSLCSEPDSCFGNPWAIQQLCSAGAKVERASSSCGGYVVRYQSDTESSESSEWSFGPQVSASDNTLVGVVVTTGTAESCPGGVGSSKVAVYGKPCQAVDEFVAQCRPEDACKNNPKDMEEYCSLFECPQNLDDIGLRLCDDFDEGGSIIQRESSCGGVTVTMHSLFFSERSYHFDADGHLIGIVPPHSSYTSACPVGRQCEAPYEPSTSLCHPARCAAAPLESWCSGLDSCPEAESPEALQQLCAAGDTLQRFASSCGDGGVYRSGFREWSFDDAGKLAGVLLTRNSEPRCASGGYSKVHVFGEPCEAVGEGVDQCGAGDSSPAP